MKPNVYRILVKTDTHGNKTFRTNACKRCGGEGRVYTSDYDHGRCFDCGGSGLGPERKTVEYTPEQRQLRQEKAAAKRLGTLEQQFRALGCNTDGVGYRVLGDSYAVKDKIKQAGGRWNGVFWTMPEKPDFAESMEIHARIIDCGKYFPYQVAQVNRFMDIEQH